LGLSQIPILFGESQIAFLVDKVKYVDGITPICVGKHIFFVGYLDPHSGLVWFQNRLITTHTDLYRIFHLPGWPFPQKCWVSSNSWWHIPIFKHPALMAFPLPWCYQNSLHSRLILHQMQVFVIPAHTFSIIYYWLVVWNIFSHILGTIISTDEHIFQDG
jgi:hypothetical protein